MSTLDEIRDAALRLPVSDRMALVEELYDSLDERPGVRPEDLKEVLAARLAAIDRGEMELLDSEEVVARLRRQLADRRRRS